MEKKLLVTISEDKAAHLSVHFIGQFVENKRDLAITLFYTAPKAEGSLPPSTFEEKISTERLQEYYMAKGRKAVEDAEKELLAYGFSREQITQKLIHRKFGKIMDIVQEAEKGLYDVVLLGRRGLSLFEELFSPSVTKEILEHPITVPIWICRNPKDKKDIAVCFDGSEPSERCLEHILFMFQGEPKHTLDVFSVIEPEKDMEELYSKVKHIVDLVGFDVNRLNFKPIKNGKPASLLIKHVKDRYGMVACGRTGKGSGLFGKLFMGSVSYELFRSLRDTTLCITR